jgi:glycosyltransferase involved in cell wall biosynthesis
MKIGIYVQTWHVGGVAVFCERLARGLQEAGHSPLLILATPYGKRDEAGRLAYARLIRTTPFPVVCLHLNAFHPKERAWRAADLIAALQCEVIFLSAHKALAGALPFLRHQATLIGIAHTDDEDSYAEFCAAEQFCAAYVGVSTAITETLQSLRKSLPQTAVRQIPYGVPFTPSQAAPAPRPARILVVSRLVQRQKRVLDLPLVWRRYVTKGGNGTLTICGSGEEQERLRAAFVDEIHNGQVAVTGAVPLERMPEVYASHDVLLSVSAYEGLPWVVLEAAAAGLYPVVSKIRSGHPEILECLSEGRVCEVCDIDGFATALVDVCNRIESVRTLRPVLSTRVQAKFGLPQMVKSYLQLAGDALETGSLTRLQRPASETKLARPRVDFVRRLIRRWQYGRHYDFHNQSDALKLEPPSGEGA